MRNGPGIVTAAVLCPASGVLKRLSPFVIKALFTTCSHSIIQCKALHAGLKENGAQDNACAMRLECCDVENSMPAYACTKTNHVKSKTVHPLGS